MMNPKRTFFILIAMCLLGRVVYANSPVVVLRDDKGEEIFTFQPPEGRFTVRFLHSWARSPVDEIFQIDEKNNIVLKETVYEDFGAGLPHEPENPAASMTVENGKIYIRNIDRIVPDLQIRTGQIAAAHTLIYGDRQVPFSDFSKPRGAVIFTIKKTR